MTVEKELLAIIKGLAYFRDLILGQRIVIKSDNKNIIHLNSNINRRFRRWKGANFEYDVQ